MSFSLPSLPSRNCGSNNNSSENDDNNISGDGRNSQNSDAISDNDNDNSGWVGCNSNNNSNGDCNQWQNFNQNFGGAKIKLTNMNFIHLSTF